MDSQGDLQGLGAVLDEILHTRPWRPGVRLGQLARRWPEVVGGRLSEECAPVRLDSGVLTVRASSGAWGAQISFLAAHIRSRANEIVGAQAVERVRVVIDGPGTPGDASQ